MNKQIIDLSDRNNSFYWQADRAVTEIQIKQIFLDRHNTFDEKETIAAIEYGMKQHGKSPTEAKVVHIDTPIKSGSINSVCKATLTDGTEVIIRMHPKNVKNGYFWSEKVAAQTAKNHGIPAFSTYLVDDTRSKFPFDYMIMEVLPGQNMKLSGPYPPSVDAQLMEETGRYLAMIHKIKVNRFGFFDNLIAKNENKLQGIHAQWFQHVFAALQSNLSYLSEMNMITSEQQKELNSHFENHKKTIQCDSPRLIQNDLADWNQLTDGKHITGILDWDECFAGDPICDFSTWSLFFDFNRMSHLKKGYETITKLPDDFEEKFHIYRLRYIISKMTLRTKRSVYEHTEFITTLLAYSKKALSDELLWFGHHT